MAKLRAKASNDVVYIDTSCDILALVFRRTANPLTTRVQVLRNGKQMDVDFEVNGKDPDFGLHRAKFENIVPTDRRQTCPRCHSAIH